MFIKALSLFKFYKARLDEYNFKKKYKESQWREDYIYLYYARLNRQGDNKKYMANICRTISVKNHLTAHCYIAPLSHAKSCIIF